MSDLRLTQFPYLGSGVPEVKLCDFEFSKIIRQEAMLGRQTQKPQAFTIVGTIDTERCFCWMAYEVSNAAPMRYVVCVCILMF